MSDPTPQDPRAAARQSYAGQHMTQGEFDDAYAITGIIAREIQKSGSFYEARENYAFAYSKGKKISPDQAQEMIADVFTARHGQSMNQMREAMLEREKTVGVEQAAPYAQKVGPLIQDGDTMPFYQAYDRAAVEMAQTHGITETRAKSLMKDAHGDRDDGRTLYDMGKELEEAYHRPVAEAASAARKAQAIENRQKVRPRP